MMGLPTHDVDLAKLRKLVHAYLCDLGQLEVGAFQMAERLVVQAGEACGIHFCLHGPRSVKLAAIYDMRRRQVLVYGSDGRRIASLETGRAR